MRTIAISFIIMVALLATRYGNIVKELASSVACEVTPAPKLDAVPMP